MFAATQVTVAPSRLARFSAYLAIYIIWGASFLAIRVIVAAVPPLLAAGVRFLCAGIILFVWAMVRGLPHPTPRQWRSALFLGVVMFACNYGPLFWAEQRVPSGVAAIVSALIPVWIAGFEWSRSGSTAPIRLLIGTICGLGGVITLSLTPSHVSSERIQFTALLALLAGTVAWAVGTIWSRHLALPSSKPVSAGIQMMLGGATLTLASVSSGDAHGFAPSQLTLPVVVSMFYLVFAASILAFTAYVWLLGHDSATRVASYAYVNPVVAVLIGWGIGGEKLSWQVISGMILVLAGVISVLSRPATSQPTLPIDARLST